MSKAKNKKRRYSAKHMTLREYRQGSSERTRALIGYATPQRVDFLFNEADQHCAKLGMMGFTTDAISDATGYTPCQVTYRLGLLGLKRADYRRGENEYAQSFMRDSDVVLDPHHCLAKILSHFTGKRINYSRGKFYIS